MEKFVRIIVNGVLQNDIVKINRNTVSFGKEGTHVTISSCVEDHSFDIVFDGITSTNGKLRTYTKNVKLNGMEINENSVVNIIDGDVIGVGEISLLYYVNELKEDWKEEYERRKKRVLTKEREFKNIKRYSFVDKYVGFVKKEEEVKEVKEEVKEVKETLQSINWKGEVEQENEENESKQPKKSKSKEIKQTPLTPLTNSRRNSNLEDKKTKEDSSTLEDKLTEIDNQIKKDEDVDDSSCILTLNKSLFSETDDKSVTMETSFKERPSLNNGNSSSWSDPDNIYIDDIEDDDDEDKKEEEKKEEDKKEEENVSKVTKRKRTSDNIDNIVEGEKDDNFDFGVCSLNDFSVETPEELEERKQIEEAERYAKQFETKSMKKSILPRKGITGNVFYFGGNSVLIKKYRKQIMHYGGKVLEGYPTDVSDKELSFYVCEKGKEGPTMPYLCCILMRVLVISTHFLELSINNDANYEDHLLPLFPFSSIVKGKLLNGYKLNINDLPKQPINFIPCSTNIYKFAIKRLNSLAHRRISMGSDSVAANERLEQEYAKKFIELIGCNYIEGIEGRTNAYNFFCEFLTDKNENSKFSTRHSFNPLTSGDYVDMTWVFEMLKRQEFVDPKDPNIKPKDSLTISKFDNLSEL